MATLTARATKKRAEGAADRARSSLKSISRRNRRNGVGRGMSLGPMKRLLQGSSSLGPGSDPLAATRPISPVSYSRILPRPIFAHPREACPFVGVPPRLAERIVKIRSAFPGPFIQTVASFGALAGLFLISNPIRTIRDAVPSVMKLSGASQ